MKRLIFGTVSILALSSCASLNDKGKSVGLTHSEEDVKNCLSIQDVSAYPPYALPSDWKIKIRNAAGKVGADTVLTTPSPWTPTVTGKAYKCKD
jgi:hypothetical protein